MEWCAARWSTDYHVTASRIDPRGPNAGDSRVMKGGSFLGHKSYCNRYRVSARTSQTPIVPHRTSDFDARDSSPIGLSLQNVGGKVYAGSLQSMLGTPVMDKTGLAGAYDVELQWAAMDLHSDEAANAISTDGPSLFSALNEQLGLRLVSHKEKFEVVVVDAISPPNPN